MHLDVLGQPAFVASSRNAAAQSPALVFVHGAGMDHSVWALYRRFYMGRGLQSLAVDLPGHGRSAGEPLASIEDMADWLVALLEELKIDRCALVGHSMGALISLAAAALHPDPIGCLVLAGVSVPMAVHPELLRLARDGDEGAIEILAGHGLTYRDRLGGGRSAGLCMEQLSQRLLTRAPLAALAVDLAACAAYDEGLAHAAKVLCPTHLILGDEDALVPRSASQPLAQALKSGRAPVATRTLATGHLMMIEQPEPFHQALHASLQEYIRREGSIN